MIALIEYESHVQILRNMLSEETASRNALHAGTRAESRRSVCRYRLIKLSTY